MTDRVGEMLGTYRLMRLVGRGGFADVYLGEHLYLNTKAAIKVLQTRLTNEDSTNFINEARTIANLIHPHIVRVLDFGLQEGVPYLVMDFAPNGTLRQRYPKGTPISPERLVPHVKQVASALMFAHDRRLIHRDIKPENMLLSATDEILLSDFGIALVTQSSRLAGTMEVVGTAGYMSPEQIQGKPRPASDQYALGIVIYEWLTGERPFVGTFTEVATQHMFAPPPPLHQKVPSLSRDIEEVVMMALAKDAQQRFQTIQAFATAFEQAAQSDSPTYVTPHSLSPPTGITRRQDTIISSPDLSLIQENARTIAAPSPEHVIPEVAPHRGVSRRMMVFGLAGAAAVAVAGGGLAFWSVVHPGPAAVSPQPTAHPTAHPTASPAPTQIAQPTSTPTANLSTSPTIGKQVYIYRGQQTGSVFADAWSPSGTQVVSCGQDKTVQVWDATTGNNALAYPGNTDQDFAIAWSANGQLIAAGGNDNVVHVWNANTASFVYNYTRHSDKIYSLVFSPDGALIASGGADNTVQVWDATSGNLVLKYTNHSDNVRGVAWSPDGRSIASASEDKTVQLWDAKTGQFLGIYSGHSQGVLIVAWSPDSKLLVSGSRDTTAQVWDAATRSTIHVYRGHTARIWGVDWSPSGNRIASCGNDSTVQIWDAASASHIYTYTGHSLTVWSALWSPNGQLIASVSNDGTAQVWQSI